MTAAHPKREKRKLTGSRARPELSWDVILHNDWDNSMLRVVLILKTVIPNMTYKRAAGITY